MSKLTNEDVHTTAIPNLEALSKEILSGEPDKTVQIWKCIAFWSVGISVGFHLFVLPVLLRS